jgi:hypothetical protein
VAFFETKSLNKNFDRDAVPKDINGSMERYQPGLFAGFCFNLAKAVWFDKSTALRAA